MPDSKWLKDLFPSVEKVDSFRGSLMDLSSKFKDSLENLDIGIYSALLYVEYVYSFLFFLFLDPRLKVFGERKVSELRAWFDSRLEDAIKAAEEEGKISPAQGTDYNLFRFLFASFSISSCKKVFGFFFNVCFLCLL